VSLVTSRTATQVPLTPLPITLESGPLWPLLRCRTVGVYLGVYRSQELLDIMTRTGKREEMSQGPIWYGLVLVAATLVCWRQAPAGMAAVAMMCAGDGCAELAGQLLGGPRWPHNRRKTLAGSCALAAAGFAAAFGYGAGTTGRFVGPRPPLVVPCCTVLSCGFQLWGLSHRASPAGQGSALICTSSPLLLLALAAGAPAELPPCGLAFLR
jgi:hypothetical protein